MSKKINDPIIKNKKSRFVKITILAELIAVTTGLLTSCYTLNPVYNLHSGNSAYTEVGVAQQNNTTLNYGEVFGTSGYISANNLNSYLRQEKGIKMNIDNNRVFFVLDIDLYKSHKDDIDWCCQYVATLLNVVSPGIAFTKSYSEDIMADDKVRDGSIIYVGNIDASGEEYLAKNYREINSAQSKIDNYILLNNRYNEDFKQNSYFRTALLHEMLHCFGLPHIEKTQGGNIMRTSVSSSIYPMAISPEEMRCVISMYGDVSRGDFYEAYLKWYEEQYDACLEVAKNNAELFDNATLDEKSIIIESNTIPLSAFHYNRDNSLDI